MTEADREERKKDLSDWRNQAPVKPVEERLRIAKIGRDSVSVKPGTYRLS